MSEFDKWFNSLNEGGRTTYFLGQEGNISKEAWYFQQAKINDSENTRAVLYRENIDIREKNIDLRAKIDELQARIDEASQMLEYNEYTDSALQAIDILKGERSE